MSELDGLNEIAVQQNDSESEENDGISFESPVVKVLNSFNVPPDTIANIRRHDIQHKDLSALSEEDFRLFGLQDESKRKQIVERLSMCPNQVENLEKFLLTLDVADYCKTVNHNIIDQMERMSKTFALMQMPLEMNSIETDKLIDDNLHVSTLSRRILAEIDNIITGSMQPQQKAKTASAWPFLAIALTLFTLGSVVMIRKLK